MSLRGRSTAIVIVLAVTVSSLAGLFPEDAQLDVPTGPAIPSDGAAVPEPVHLLHLTDLGNTFIENRGQVVDGECLYYSVGRPLAAYFSKDGVRLRHVAAGDGITTLTISFEGTTGTGPVASMEARHRSSFIYGDDPARWQRDVRGYQRLTYPSLYPGIDLVFRFDENRLKYDIEVGPGADPSQVRLSYEGHLYLSVDGDSGDLVVQAEGWTLVDQAPVAYQLVDGVSTGVGCRFDIEGDRVVSFLVDDHDDHEMLVIDPGIEFSTLLGTDLSDFPADMHITEDGDLFVVGTTFSPNFPTAGGPYDDDFNDLADIIVCKFDSEGSQLLYSTYIGGGSTDTPFDIAVTSVGKVHVVGETLSEDFPVTATAYDSTHNGYQDAFALGLNATLDSLDYSTYIGAEGYDSANSVELGPSGEVYILGWTYGSGFPVTGGALDTTPNGDSDIFVAGFHPTGDSLIFSTLYGGVAWDRAMDMEFVSPDRLYITGATGSRDFPTTHGAYNRSTPGSPVGGMGYIYACCLKTNGRLMYQSSTIGPGGFENIGQNIKIDPEGNVVIAATSGYYGYPTTPGSYVSRYNETMSGYCGVISKLDSDLSRLLASTYLGGNMNDFVVSLAIDDVGNSYVTGWTYSDNFPNTTKALDRSYGGWGDAFLAKLDTDLESLLYGTFIGGEKQERGISVWVDQWGRVVVSGWTESPEFETTEGAYDRTHGGNRDAFLMGFWTEDEAGTVLRPLKTSRLFAGYKHYTFTVRGNPFHSDDAPDRVELFLDAQGVNVSMSWDPARNGNPFAVESDPGHLVHLDSDFTDVKVNSTRRDTLLHFRVLFNWTWPHEDTCNVTVRMRGGDPPVPDVTVLGFFSVENDLQMVGDMKARGHLQGPLEVLDWVKAGEMVEVWGPMVTYENASTVFPPDGVCDIVLQDNGGNRASEPLRSGRSIEMAIMVENGTDLHEVLDLDLENLPGLAEFVSRRYFHLRVDGDAPIYTNMVPDPDSWHCQHEVTLAVTADDPETSGLVTSSLEYSVSKRGTTGYGDWTQDGLQLHQEGTALEAMFSMDFPNGEANHIRWRVRDRVGNVGTTGDLRIRVDTHNVTFTDPVPGAYAWQCSIDVECGVTIQDIEGSGIDVSSVQYRYSHRNLSMYSDWQDWDEGDIVDAEIVVTSTLVVFDFSTLNYIQWRAMDIAGNGYTTSPHYRILVDVNPIEFYEFEPWGSNLLFNHSNIECVVWVRDDPGGSGVDLSTLQYRYTMEDGEFSEWLDMGMTGVAEDTHFSYIVTLPDGMHNKVQFRGHDLAGNGPTESRDYTIKVDAHGPELMVTSPSPEDKQRGPSADIMFQVWDHVSQLDTGSVRYRFQRMGSDRFTAWNVIEVEPQADRFVGTLSPNLTPGRYNVVQVRAYDHAGNLGNVETTVWLNSPPVAVIEAPVEGGRYNGTLPLNLSANGSADIDGDPLNFTWYLGDSDESTATGMLAEVQLWGGNFSLRLVVEDDMGATDTANVTFSAYGPPPPVEPDPPEVESIDEDYWFIIIILVIAAVLSLMYLLRDRMVRERS